MRLILRQADGTSKELTFTEGPIRIGRAANSDVLLPSRGVSRQHAVLSTDGNENWTIEDMDSANKTYLNGTTVHKAEIRSSKNSLRHLESLCSPDSVLDICLGCCMKSWFLQWRPTVRWQRASKRSKTRGRRH